MKIYQIDYHYYWQLEEGINDYEKEGFTFIQLIDISPSGNTEKMHRATIIFRIK